MSDLQFREQWLNRAAQLILAEVMPFQLSNYRLSMNHSAILAETAPRAQSDDGTAEIFISAQTNSNTFILAALARQLIHAHLDDQKYGAEFQRYARQINLVPIKRSVYSDTTAGPILQPKLAEISQLLGPIPHAVLIRPPKEKGRNNNKLACDCGFKANLSAKWASQVISRQCPVCLNPASLTVIMA